MQLVIESGVGVGPIKLGTSREEARETLAKAGYPLCASHNGLDYFCENSIQLEYENEMVRFIGISDHTEIECMYNEIDVFNLKATDLFQAVAKNEPVIPHEKPGETCFFPHQGINLWEADNQYDRRGGYSRPVYAQVGIEAPKNA